MRALLLGYELYYHNELVFQHLMPSERLTLEYREKLSKGVGAISPIKRLYAYHVYLQNTKRLLIPFVLFWQVVLYILLKMKVIKRQRFAIINPFKVWRQGISKNGDYHQEYLTIKEFAEYARSF